MNRKKEIANDIWDMMREVYQINICAPQSEKQTQFIDKVVEYIDANLSTRRKKQPDDKEKECSKK